MLHMTPELWIALALQIAGYGAVRQQVKNLVDAVTEEKLERKKIDERVREVEIFLGPSLSQTLSMSKKAGSQKGEINMHQLSFWEAFAINTFAVVLRAIVKNPS